MQEARDCRITSFSIAGKPIPQQRPKFTTINGHGRAYDPAKSRNFKAEVAILASTAHWPRAPYSVEVEVYIYAWLPIPKSWSKKKQQLALDGKIRPTTRGNDCDNLAKSIMDGMTGIVYKDDSQVTSLHVYKRYSDKPRTSVLVTGWLTDDELKVFDPKAWQARQEAMR